MSECSCLLAGNFFDPSTRAFSSSFGLGLGFVIGRSAFIRPRSFGELSSTLVMGSFFERLRCIFGIDCSFDLRLWIASSVKLSSSAISAVSFSVGCVNLPLSAAPSVILAVSPGNLPHRLSWHLRQPVPHQPTPRLEDCLDPLELVSSYRIWESPGPS